MDEQRAGLTAGRPRLCFVGPLLGRNRGRVVSQGEILAELLARDGYAVRTTSHVPWRIVRLADTIGSLLRWSRQVDVVVVLVFGGLGFAMADLSSWLAKRLGKPLVLALHGGSLPSLARRQRAWTKRVLRRADAIVAPSGYLVQAFGALGFDVRIIPNVLDIHRYPYRRRSALRPTLLWMRTFHDNYHPELAIEVLHAVRASHPEVRLTMAGQDERGRLRAVQRLVKKHGLSTCVRFPGFLDAAGKWREFSEHDIFLNTNRVDNMPVSLLEAAACGLPIVSTDVGGIPFVFEHEQTAVLVGREDANGMTRAVERLLDEPALAATLSRNARRLAERCGWAAVRPEWEALFAELLGDARRAP